MKLNNREVIAVDVPFAIDKIEITNDVFEAWGFNDNGIYTHVVHVLPKNEWYLLERAYNITEEQARELVESELISVGYVYLDYEQPETVKRPYKFDYALESFQSWCRANGITNQVLLIQKA